MTETSQTLMLEWVGRRVHGYCNGFFGRDDYGTKVIEAIGPGWIVARGIEGDVLFATFTNWTEMLELLQEWADEQPT